MDARSAGQKSGIPTQTSASDAPQPVPGQPGGGTVRPGHGFGAPARGRLPRRVLLISGGVVVTVACVIAAIVGLALLYPSHAGQVIFTTDPPTSESARTCQFDHQVTSVTAGTPVYAVYFYKARLANETIALTVDKDGTPIAQNALAPLASDGVDCLEDPLDLRSVGALGVGRYDFKMTIATGEIVSEGTLIIEAPTPPPTRRPVTPTGHAGQVVFTTDMPPGASAASCKLGHEVTSVTVGTPVYATYFYKARLANETVTLWVSKDGTPIAENAVASAESNDVDCTALPVDVRIYGAIGPGRYDFKMVTATGEIVSEGTLIIEAPTSLPSQSPATPS